MSRFISLSSTSRIRGTPVPTGARPAVCRQLMRCSRTATRSSVALICALDEDSFHVPVQSAPVVVGDVLGCNHHDGNIAPRRIVRSSVMKSNPSSSGIIRSRTMAAGTCAVIRCRAVRPFDASTMSHPCERSCRLNISRIAGSSSMMSASGPGGRTCLLLQHRTKAERVDRLGQEVGCPQGVPLIPDRRSS